MSPLVRKELRLILPFWAIAMFLAILPSFLAPGDGWVSGVNEIIYCAFGFGAVLLGLAPFGQEFSLATFPSLLAQPLERRQMWKVKLLLILPASFLVLLAFMVAVHFRLADDLKDSMERFVPLQHGLSPNTHLEELKKSTVDFYHSYFWVSCVAGGAILLFVGLAGGFWSSLLFRQTGAALWFAILIPGVILVAAEVIGHLFLFNPNFVLFPVLAIYALGGFIWARRMFLAAQDAQWLGGTISFLSLNPAKEQTESVTIRRKKPLAALLRKELQSHQVSFLIAFGLLVLHIATLVVRGLYPMNRSSELRFAVEAVPLLWLMLPWVIGSVAVAEERKLGTMEGQLCLPVSRRLQFIVKLLVTLFLGVALGACMPCLIESLGVLAHVPSEIVQRESVEGVYFTNLFEMALGAGAIAFISFFASTLTRNTLHALGMGVVLGGIFIGLLQFITWSHGYDNRLWLWRGPLVFAMVIPTWIIAVAWLSFSNYKRLHAGRNVWLRNFLVLAISLACAGLFAAVLYQRPWELAMSIEPKHGPAQLSGPVRPVLRTCQSRTFALLPDGRLWAGTNYEWKSIYAPRTGPNGEATNEEIVRYAIPQGGMFIGGSNWVALAASSYFAQVIALQSDGSLWDIIPFHARTNFWKRWLTAVPEPRRISTNNDWKSIGTGQYFFAGVKKDGTLWSWNSKEGEFPLASRFGSAAAGSDWSEVFTGKWSPLFMKQNGDIYVLEQTWGKTPGQSTNLVTTLVSTGINASDWLDVDEGYRQKLIVRKDGSLWVWNSTGGRFFGHRIPMPEMLVNNGMYSPVPSDRLVRIGKDSDWAQVAGDDDINLYGLKKNGRLIKNATELFSATLGRPSAYSDWVAIDSHWGDLFALSADGTLCQWENQAGWDRPRWFTTAHHPLWTLNIFSDSKN